jgi:hypothetical protein
MTTLERGASTDAPGPAAVRPFRVDVPADIATALQLGNPAPAGLSADEQFAWEQLDSFYKHGLAYAQEMGNRPQTLYALADSPVGLAAWMLDHDKRSQALIARVFAGQREGLTRDDILDNVTLYWLTTAGAPLAALSRTRQERTT